MDGQGIYYCRIKKTGKEQIISGEYFQPFTLFIDERVAIMYLQSFPKAGYQLFDR